MITPDEAKFNADWLEKEGYKPEADFIRDLAQQVEDLQAEIAKSKKPAVIKIEKYGCHIDLEPGMKPDGCVFDSGREDDCCCAIQLAHQGKGKQDCEYWQVIKGPA